MLFFESWQEVLRVIISAPIVYAAIVAFVRISGKRSTSQMNNFDWIVTVAMGSIASASIVSKDVTIVDGLTAIATLLLLQFILTKLNWHSDLFAHWVRSKPTIVFYQGEFQTAAMQRERITQAEIISALRESGIQHLERVEAVVLETDAKLSVLPKAEKSLGAPLTLANTSNYQSLYGATEVAQSAKGRSDA